MRLAVVVPVLAVAAAAIVAVQNMDHKAARSASPVTFATFNKQQFAVLSTELSPAVVVRSGSRSVSFFRNMFYWGLEGPTYAAVPVDGGVVQVLSRGKGTKRKMREAWILCWFNGSKGWNNWDAPVLLVLQHHPRSVSLSKDGLTIDFPKDAGLIAVMPLYGYQKIPLDKRTDYLARHNLPSKGISTGGWRKSIPSSVAARCRYFTRTLRMVPVYCREEFALEGNDLLIRSKFSWLPITDEWGTKPIKLAPVPPVMSLAMWSGKNAARKPFPMKFSHPVKDADLFTPFGPYIGVENSDGYTVRMSVLKYVHFAEKPLPADLKAHPVALDVSEKLQKKLEGKFRSSDWQRIWDHGGSENFCWQVMGDRWYAKAIPYLPADTQGHVKASLTSYMRDFILKEQNYKEFENMLLLTGPGVSTWGGFDDAGKFSSNLLETLWEINYYAGGTDIIRSNWPMIKRFFVTPLECDWKSRGRYTIAELGDEAAPALAMARLAYRAGDKNTYAFASYIFGGELLHHYVKQSGAKYFRLHQPWHSDEFLPAEVYLTNLWGDVAGWQVDGPAYPEDAGERQYNNRWVRFSSDEVAWFYRDYLSAEIKAEMDLLTLRAQSDKVKYELYKDRAHTAPSLVRLRAMLLNESPEKLVKLAHPVMWKSDRSADVAAMCVSILHNTRPVQRVRLIGPAKTDYALGLERAVKSGSPALTMVADASADRSVPSGLRGYPFLRWRGWRAPQKVEDLPEGKWWSFGQITPAGFKPRSVDSKQLNWNTKVMVFR